MSSWQSDLYLSGRATTCYMSRQGIAYQLWLRMEQLRVDRGWTKVQLAEHFGLSRTTVDNLRVSPNPAMAPTINTIADGLDIGRREAARLAGVLPLEPSREVGDDPVRSAILADPILSNVQKQLLLGLKAELDRANGVNTRRNPGRPGGHSSDLPDQTG